MKKILWLLFIILLFGLGFLYLLKNPSLPASQIIFTILDVRIETNKELSGAYLIHCADYYDGCNTCTIKEGKVKACTLMQCDNYSETECIAYETGYDAEKVEAERLQGLWIVETTWTVDTWIVEIPSIDLTNCVSYFDGCNNCSVKDGKPEACTEMYCATPSQPRCTQYATWMEPTETVDTWIIENIWTLENTWSLENISWGINGQASGNITQ